MEYVMTKPNGWTGGPWSVNRHGAVVGGPIQTYANGSGQDQIAMACMTNSIDGDAMQANARLIAAAPQLYEALAALIDFAEPVLKNHGFGYMGKFEKARAALAAARGEG